MMPWTALEPLLFAGTHARLAHAGSTPHRQMEDFKSVTKFRVFNTNNLWIKLSAIKELYEQDAIDMEIIENKKVRRVLARAGRARFRETHTRASCAREAHTSAVRSSLFPFLTPSVSAFFPLPCLPGARRWPRRHPAGAGCRVGH